MANRYSSAFSGEISSKQAGLIFFSLYDSAAEDKAKLYELEEAYKEASRKAEDRERKAAKEAAARGYMLCL